MFALVTRILIASTTLLFSIQSYCCSCDYGRPMDDAVASASVVFYGELIGIEKVGTIAKSGNYQEYKLTLYPQKVFKGRAKKKYIFNTKALYNDQDSQQIVVDSCSLDLDLGSKYVVLIERGQEIDWSWCSESVLLQGTGKYKYFMKNKPDMF